MNYLAENTFLTKENYEERLKEIKSWFDKENEAGDYDALSNIEELKLQCEAKDAYIRHLEAPAIATNTQYVVEYIGVKDDRKFYKYCYFNTEAEALAVFDVLSKENQYISYMKVFDLNNKIIKEMECGKVMNKVLEDITNEENIGNFPKHVWLDFVSDELKDKLFKLKSDNGMVPLGTVDEIVQLFVNDIEKIGNALEKEREKVKSHAFVEFPTNIGG